jgi:hypothetical protein
VLQCKDRDGILEKGLLHGIEVANGQDYSRKSTAGAPKRT